MGNDRTAIDTITGYYYQFDYYILKLLEQDSPENTVCIEGIEDVDIHTHEETTAVQCKYYSKTEYNHSVIAKPVRLMLTHYKDNQAGRKDTYYRIYGNFLSGQNKLPHTITVNFLKEEFLTYTRNKVRHKFYQENGLSDAELQDFISHLVININAVEFHEQENRIIKKLHEIFRCNDFDAEYYYYNNALRLIKHLATSQEIKDRTISRATFEASINQKQYLFDSWYLEYKGIKEYCKAVKAQYFSQVNISPYERFFLIECDQRVSGQQIKSLLIKISKNWSRLSKNEPRSFCPYIYLYGVSDQLIIRISNVFKMTIYTSGMAMTLKEQIFQQNLLSVKQQRTMASS